MGEAGLGGRNVFSRHIILSSWDTHTACWTLSICALDHWAPRPPVYCEGTPKVCFANFGMPRLRCVYNAQHDRLAKLDLHFVESWEDTSPNLGDCRGQRLELSCPDELQDLAPLDVPYPEDVDYCCVLKWDARLENVEYCHTNCSLALSGSAQISLRDLGRE